MSRVLTNNISLAYAIEDTVGVLPGSPTWHLLEPNTINSFGANITTVAREPISKNRQRKKGTTTDLDSVVEIEHDLTLNPFIDFLEAFVFANFQGLAVFEPTAAVAGGSGGYTVASGGALTANALVYARGFLTAANNGLKVVQSGSGGTNIRVNSLSAETVSPTGSTEVAIAGVQGAEGDIQVNSSGNIFSTSLDFTTLNLTVGQVIWVGGSAAGTQFAETANTGFARITAIAANLLTLDKKSTTFVEADGDYKTIQLLFGRFLKNVTVDDGDYLERKLQFEAAFPDLGGVGVDEYEYAIGNFCNEVSLSLPLTNKAGVTFGFIGTDTEVPTTVRKTNASSARSPIQTAAFNTSADIGRLRITEVDETGLTTDFKNITLTLNNNVSAEKVLGTLGASNMNTGNFFVNIETQVLFTDSDVTTAIRNNTTVTMDFSVQNDDGGIFFDIPSLTLGGGNKDFPVNESLLINLSGEAFEDATLGYSIGVSLFPFLP